MQLLALKLQIELFIPWHYVFWVLKNAEVKYSLKHSLNKFVISLEFSCDFVYTTQLQYYSYFQKVKEIKRQDKNTLLKYII